MGRRSARAARTSSSPRSTGHRSSAGWLLDRRRGKPRAGVGAPHQARGVGWSPCWPCSTTTRIPGFPPPSWNSTSRRCRVATGRAASRCTPAESAAATSTSSWRTWAAPTLMPPPRVPVPAWPRDRRDGHRHRPGLRGPGRHRVAVNPDMNCLARGIDPLCRPCANGWPSSCHNAFSGVLTPGSALGFTSDLGGGWAEQVVAHHSMLHRVPDTVTDQAVSLHEPVSIAVHGLLRDPPRDGDPVLVVGRRGDHRACQRRGRQGAVPEQPGDGPRPPPPPSGGRRGDRRRPRRDRAGRQGALRRAGGGEWGAAVGSETSRCSSLAGSPTSSTPSAIRAPVNDACSGPSTTAARPAAPRRRDRRVRPDTGLVEGGRACRCRPPLH